MPGGQGEAAQDGAGEDYASQVTEAVSFDVAVVGSGPSGLAAGVQAGELGLKVIMLEASDIRGGMTVGAEGMAAAGSPLQQEAGIEFDISEVADHMAAISEYKVSALLWKNMLERSGDNAGWLIDKGVAFSGVVDDYKGDGLWPTFHWFEGDFACPTAYGDPMEAAFKGFDGCELRLQTRARQLKLDEAGRVAGLYATTAEGGVLEVDAKAVILATGGYARNAETVAQVYPQLYAGRYVCTGGPADCVGDGRAMAIAAGARVETDHAAFMTPRAVTANTSEASLQGLGRLASGIWVNQDGSRYIREDCGSSAVGAPLNSMLQQWATYVVVDAGLVGSLSEQFPDGAELLEAEAGDGEVFEGQTVEELAGQMGLDPDALAATVSEYNEMAAAGKDAAFGKAAESLVALENPPYFALRQVYSPYKVLGSTSVNPAYEVIDDAYEAIPGLYAVGTEANANYYKSAYSYHCAGGCCAQCVDSGRVAARGAAAYIGA